MQPHHPHKHRGPLKLYHAARCSLQGLACAYRFESAFRLELYGSLVLAPIALLLPLPTLERLWLIATLFLVLLCEILNSAIEAVVDRIGTEQHELSGRAKDLGSAAVFVAAVLAALSWGWLCWPLLVARLA